jgi:4-amino-4-deoxy-L-arabinose transferase-like glycosyltransferase
VTQFFRRRGIAIIVLLVLVIYGLEAQARRKWMSTPTSFGDQGAYLAYAQQLHESGYAFVSDRNRMPVYPFLLSLIYRPGLTETEFLTRAQIFNVNLSIVLLLVLFFIFRRYFPPLYAVALLCATAFGVFVYRAGHAQTEVLYYFVSFCAFVLLLRMLIAPRWWLAVLSGATVGVAHLTKASVLPALGIWIAVFVAQMLWGWRRRREPGSTKAWQTLGMLLLVIAIFLTVVFPYIQTSAKIYGQFFYNVNSNFVMWCDSASEAWDFLSSYGDHAKWRELSPELLPSPQKYWREHSIGEIAYRLGHGLRRLATQNARAIGYYKFVVALVLAAGVFVVRQRHRGRELLAEQPFAAAFCFLFFAIYLLLYAWYDAIVNDTRFVLSIFLPFIFAMSIFELKMGKDRAVVIAGWRLPFAQFFAGLVICLSLVDVLYNAAF